MSPPRCHPGRKKESSAVDPARWVHSGAIDLNGLILRTSSTISPGVQGGMIGIQQLQLLHVTYPGRAVAVIENKQRLHPVVFHA